MNLKYQFETRMESSPGISLAALKLARLVWIPVVLLFFSSTAKAQFSNVEYMQNLDQSSSPSATDILSKKTTVGRFGAVSRGGWLSPSPNVNRRFSEGAVYTPSGGFVGLSTNSSNSRFQSWWSQSQTLPQTDYSVYSDFLSVKRGTDMYDRMGVQNETPAVRQGTLLSQKQASSPLPLPYPTRTTAQDQRDTTGMSAGPSPGQPIRTTGTTEQIWMRGRLPDGTPTTPNNAPTANAQGTNAQATNSQGTGMQAVEGSLRLSGQGAGMSQQQAPQQMIPQPAMGVDVQQPPLYPTSPTQAWPSGNQGPSTQEPIGLRESLPQEQAPKKTSQQGVVQQGVVQQGVSPGDAAQGLVEQQRYEQRRLAGTSIEQLQARQSATTSVESIESSLEQLLIRHPGVKPLSPVQVQFRDGTATIRGVVPSQTHRVEAGRVLLSDPRVKTVDNQLTVLPANSKD